jgi:hypothetical protein
MSEILGGGLGLFVGFFLFMLAVLWFLLPFAIFGTKDKLSALILESQRINEQLAGLREDIIAISGKENNE